MKIKYISFDNKIVIYLKHDEYNYKKIYSYYINHRFVDKNKESHYIFDNLIDSTKYLIEVKSGEHLLCKKIISTLPKREEIIVPEELTKKKICTKELQEILDNASGKKIVFVKGVYYTGALFIKPNTFIEICKNAVIKGSDNPSNYLPLISSRFEGLTMKCYASLLNIGQCDWKKSRSKANIYIYGDGTITGGGKVLGENIIDALISNVDASIYDSDVTNARILAGRYRGRLIQINNSKNVVIEGLRLGYSPSWNIHTIYSKDIVIADCCIESKGIHNGDGIDPDSSINVDIFNNVFDTSDDCIAIKSGKNPEGNKIGKPSKNISIFDCKSINGHSFAIGSEISGGIKNIDVFNCDFIKTRFGVHIKTTQKRGGYVKNVTIDNVKLSSINCRFVTYNDEGFSSKDFSHFKHFKFKNIFLSGIDIGDYIEKEKEINHIEIKGFDKKPSAFSNFKFSNVKYNGEKRVVIKNAKNVRGI